MMIEMIVAHNDDDFAFWNHDEWFVRQGGSSDWNDDENDSLIDLMSDGRWVSNIHSDSYQLLYNDDEDVWMALHVTPS